MEAQNTLICSSCGSQTLSGRPYCGKCGAAIAQICGECGSVMVQGDKYCTACGSKDDGQESGCPACKTPLKYRNQAFCTECGRLLIVQCAACGAPISGNWKFCAHCGRDLNSDKVDIRTANRVRERLGTVTDALQSQGNDAEVHNKRGLELFQNEDYEAAVEEFRAALDIEPNSASYHCNLAVALDEMDNDEEALLEYELALKLDPNDPTALLSLGYMYNENEELAKAEEVWRHLVEIAPNTAEAREALDNLNHLTEI